HPGVDVPPGPGLLLVALDRERQPALVTRPEIPDSEPGLGHLACAVDEPAAVGGERRAERAPEAGGLHRRPSGLTVVDRELVVAAGGVVLPVPAPAGEPDVAPVRAEGGAGHAHVLRPLDQLRPAPALDVVEPELGGAEAGASRD